MKAVFVLLFVVLVSVTARKIPYMKEKVLIGALKQAVRDAPPVKLPPISGNKGGLSGNITNQVMSNLMFKSASFWFDEDSTFGIKATGLSFKLTGHWEFNNKLTPLKKATGDCIVLGTDTDLTLRFALSQTNASLVDMKLNVGKLKVDMGEKHKILNFFSRVMMPLMRKAIGLMGPRIIRNGFDVPGYLRAIVQETLPIELPPAEFSKLGIKGSVSGISFNTVDFSLAASQPILDQLVVNVTNLVGDTSLQYTYVQPLVNAKGTGRIHIEGWGMVIALDLSKFKDGELEVGLVSTEVTQGNLVLNIDNKHPKATQWIIEHFTGAVKKVVVLALKRQIRSLFTSNPAAVAA